MNAGMTRYLAESLGWLLGLGRLVVHTLVGFISRMVPVPNCFTSTPSTTKGWDKYKFGTCIHLVEQAIKRHISLGDILGGLNICRLVMIL